jgi:hypothetical protein
VSTVSRRRKTHRNTSASRNQGPDDRGTGKAPAWLTPSGAGSGKQHLTRHRAAPRQRHRAARAPRRTAAPDRKHRALPPRGTEQTPARQNRSVSRGPETDAPGTEQHQTAWQAAAPSSTTPSSAWRHSAQQLPLTSTEPLPAPRNTAAIRPQTQAGARGPGPELLPSDAGEALAPDTTDPQLPVSPKTLERNRSKARRPGFAARAGEVMGAPSMRRPTNRQPPLPERRPIKLGLLSAAVVSY